MLRLKGSTSPSMPAMRCSPTRPMMTRSSSRSNCRKPDPERVPTMDTVYVKPGEGARIRQPERNGAVMPAAGVRVERNSYYERLLLTGDVVEAGEPQETAP